MEISILNERNDTNYYKEPLLSLVREFELLYYKYGIRTSPSGMTYLYYGDECLDFAEAYFLNNVDVHFKENYLRNHYVTDALKHYQIDLSEFWYLLIYLKSKVDRSKKVPMSYETTPNDDLKRLSDEIKKMEFENLYEMHSESKYDGALYFKLELQKKTICIDNPYSLHFIAKLIDDYIPKVEDIDAFNVRCFKTDKDIKRKLLNLEEKSSLTNDEELEYKSLLRKETPYGQHTNTYRVQLFCHYLYVFFKSHLKGQQFSSNKKIGHWKNLLPKLVRIVEYDLDDRLKSEKLKFAYDALRSNYLKDYNLEKHPVGKLKSVKD